MIAENKSQKPVRNPPISHIDLDLTNNCVLACDYCFRGPKNVRRLSLETGKAAIDFLIRESGDSKQVAVLLFGGEPLMEFELIKQLVPYAKEQVAKAGKSIHFGAVTNCVLITDEVIDFFYKHKMLLHPSIDGGPESHDKHRKFLDGRGSLSVIEPNIKKLLKYWPESFARKTIANDTVHRDMEDVLYLVGLGFKNIAMVPAPEQDWTEEQFDIMQCELRKISNYYIERYRQSIPIGIKHIDDAIKKILQPQRSKFACGAGLGSVLVKTDGTLYPCHRFGGHFDAEGPGQWKLGSIFEGWAGVQREKILDFDCRKHVKADCQNCIAVHMCTTSCLAINWSCFGDITQPHPNHCRYTKMYFAEAMRVHYILDSENNQLFTKKFHPERLKNTGNTKGHRNTNPAQGGVQSPEAVFVMLSSRALSPCFMFNGDKHKTETKLSMEMLKSTFKWVTQNGASVPNLLFIADDSEKIDAPVAKFLESIPEQILVPLVSRQRQKDLQIPFSEKQAVIASNLKQLLAEKASICNRPVIAHVDHDEIDQLADMLLSVKDRIPQITLRLRNANQLNDNQIETYKKQLELAKEVLSLRTAMNLKDIGKVHPGGKSGVNSCPAGKQLITVGPDGKVYPCPAFFFNGQSDCSVDSLKSLSCVFPSLQTKTNCSCGSDQCPGCQFLKLSKYEQKEQLCKIYKAESAIAR
jgi:uncharacterized protein